MSNTRIAHLDEAAWPEGDLDPADLPGPAMPLMYRYWSESRTPPDLPGTQAIDPLLLPRTALPWILVVEVSQAPRRFRFRLSGTGVVEGSDQDLTGRYADEVPHMEALIRRFSWCVDNRRPYYTCTRITFSSKDFKYYHVLGLPFADASGAVTRLIFVIHFD